MKKNTPLVSVILPAYNAEEYIAEAIESILGQTYTHFELIIINDCSKDATLDVIRKFEKKDKRIVVLQNETNMKLSKTLNRGIDVAKGKYIARMDADDWSFPDRFALQVNFMEEHPEVGIVGGFMQIMDEKGTVFGQRTYALDDDDIRKKLYLYSPFSHPTIMIRKDILDIVGLYNHSYNPAEDYELYFRIGAVSKFANIDRYLIKYRIIPGSMTTGSMRRMEQKTLKVRFEQFNNQLYRPGLFDRIYTYIEYLSLYLVPDSFKLWLFKVIRDRKVKN